MDEYPINLAIGIVTFNNSEDEIKKVIDSAHKAAAGVCKYNIFIVDNGRPTQTLTNGDNLIVRLANNGNGGFGMGHNRLMRVAFSRGANLYIATNPDGIFEPNSIRELVKMSQDNNGRALIEAKQFPVEHPKKYDLTTFDTDWVTGACLVIPRDIYDALDGFDESFFMYCEDVDISWRARAMGFATKHCPTALFLHKVTNRIMTQATLRMFFTSGVVLASKWGAKGFENTMDNNLKRLGVASPDIRPKEVPVEWRKIADFAHQTSFAEVRW